MALVQGAVERISEKQGKFGLQIGVKVNETWYDVKKRGGMQEGDFVEFQATQNERGFWKITDGSLKAVDAPADVSKAVGTRTSSNTGTGGKGQTFSNDGRQDSIIYQSSRKDALEFVNLLFHASVIDLGKSKNMADRQAMLETYLDKYTTHFIEEVKAGKPSAMQRETEEAVKGKARPAVEAEEAEQESGGAFE